jgi:hypothetical protein
MNDFQAIKALTVDFSRAENLNDEIYTTDFYSSFKKADCYDSDQDSICSDSICSQDSISNSENFNTAVKRGIKHDRKANIATANREELIKKINDTRQRKEIEKDKADTLNLERQEEESLALKASSVSDHIEEARYNFVFFSIVNNNS